MRLFLSSQGLSNRPGELLKLIGDGRRTAFIENAKDGIDPADRKAHVLEKKQEFEQLGLDFEELDLRDYFGKKGKLLDLLSNFDLLWLSGGNTFVLRRAMTYSGLDETLKELLGDNVLALGGSSAGAIVATPSLRGAQMGDDPAVVPKGYRQDIIWEGLGLVPFYVVPHYRSEWFAKEAEAMADYFKKHKLPYKPLKDGQAIVIDGHSERFLK